MILVFDQKRHHLELSNDNMDIYRIIIFYNDQNTIYVHNSLAPHYFHSYSILSDKFGGFLFCSYFGTPNRPSLAYISDGLISSES